MHPSVRTTISIHVGAGTHIHADDNVKFSVITYH